MSTTFPLCTQVDKTNTTSLSITEQSCLFSIDMSNVADEFGDFMEMEIRHLTPNEVVEIAMSMIQPTLYSVADPHQFMEEVIKPRLAKLFV